jgi:hypothetical protein
MVKYAKISRISGIFCSKNNISLALEQNRPNIRRILVYYVVRFYGLPIGRVLLFTMENKGVVTCIRRKYWVKIQFYSFSKFH